MSDYRPSHHYPSHPHPQQPTAGPSNAPPPTYADPYATPYSDDLKYIAKYRELKGKVHEAELENDRLHLKVLKTRKNIQRLRLERAILYERLAVAPTQDTTPFPSDPTIFPPAQPSQSNPSSAHYDQFSGPEGSLEYSSQDLPRHKNTHRTQTLGPPPAPPRRQTRPSEDALHAGPSRHNKTLPDLEPAVIPSAPVLRAVDTFPFVHEYAQNPVTMPATTYPTEVRFHPCEASTHPVQRGSRRDLEQATNAGRVAERDHEIKFRHHRPETQGHETTHSPEETHGNYAYPLQHPFLSQDDDRRDEERDRLSYGPQAEEPRRHETANGNRRRKNSAGTIHERSQEDYEYERRDTGRHHSHPRRSSYSHRGQEEATHQPRSPGDERQRARRREDGAPSRMPEGEAMD